jgi:peptidoglycan/xylan/chitin deacetylase (PgdA/CDA1 family)
MEGRPRNVILCYHRLRERESVDEADDPSLARALPIVDLERQLSWLSGFCDFVTLGDMVARMRSERKPRRWTVAITFDDGYADNIEIGMPVMRRLGVRPTIFLTTRFIADPGHVAWWILLDRIAALAPDSLVALAGGEMTPKRARDVVAAQFRTRGAIACDNLHVQLVKALAAGGSPWSSPFLTPDQVRIASAGGDVDFGAHSVTHSALAACASDEIAREVVASRDAVADWTGRPPAWFAYPYGGRAHVDDRAADAVRRAGFSGAVTLIPGYATASKDPMRLPRVPVGAGHSFEEFRARILGASFLAVGGAFARGATA